MESFHLFIFCIDALSLVFIGMIVLQTMKLKLILVERDANLRSTQKDVISK